jgi:hypothetical protein
MRLASRKLQPDFQRGAGKGGRRQIPVTPQKSCRLRQVRTRSPAFDVIELSPEMADESGPQRIFDFSPQVLSLTEAVIVGNVNLAIGLETPSCFQPEIKFLVAHADPFF